MTRAKNIVDAVHLARIERFACYVIDHQLLDGTGVELCRQIRAFDSQTPILICSAEVCQSPRPLVLVTDSQGDGFTLTSPEDLKQALARLLDGEEGLSLRKSA